MHYSIWKGLSLVGKEKNPLFKGKARRESKIKIKNLFPADGTLRLGLIPSQTRIRKSALELQINHNKQYKKINGFSCRRERKEKKGKKGGDREEGIKDSHSTP